MKISLILFIALTTLFADTTFTTDEILSYVAEPTALPNMKISARARGGYGTSEMYYSPPTTDAQAQLLFQMDILSTSEIRSRRQRKEELQAEVLKELSNILSREEFIKFLKQQRTSYRQRRDVVQVRIKKGFSEQTEIFPLERYLIDLETKIQEELSIIRRGQLRIAAFAGKHWKELYAVVQKWDRHI